MRECCFEPSNWRATQTLPEYLKEHGIVAIDGVDTRRITKMLRTEGAKKSVHQHDGIRPRHADPEGD